MIQFGFALALMILGGLFALLNWMMLYQTCRTGRFHSAVPFVGAVFLGGGMLLLPLTRPFAWIALIVDYGTLVSLPALPFLAAEIWKTSRFNLLEEYEGHQENKTVQLCLFRKGIFTMKLTIRRPPGECGLIQSGLQGTWKRQDGKLQLSAYDEHATFEPCANVGQMGIRLESGFGSHEDREYSLAGIELLPKSAS